MGEIVNYITHVLPYYLEQMIDKANQFFAYLSGLVWNWPLIILLFGTHLFLTLRLGFIQRFLFKGIRLSVANDEGAEGNISQFGALATALAATIGTGNIIGVSTAIALGGPGAVFWTWITGFFGVATKYSEALLAVKFRCRKEDGTIVGGPMYVLSKALKLKYLGGFFAFATVMATLGTGSSVQSKAIASVMDTAFGIPSWIVGIVVTALVAFVIIGGLKSITSVSEKLVPFMAAFYVLACVVILCINYQYLGLAFRTIFDAAFNTRAAMGGFIGSTIMTACRYGMARGLFSNESGLGTAPIAAAPAITRNPVRQALVSMTGTFWDTLVVCLMTGLVIVSSAVRSPEAFKGIGDDMWTQVAFNNIPQVGQIILAVALAVFAFTTMLGWAYYGETCLVYLLGEKSRMFYRIAFLIMSMVGCVVANLSLIWNYSDFFNGLMVIPNVICLLLLNKVLFAETKKYLFSKQLHLAADDKPFSI